MAVAVFTPGARSEALRRVASCPSFPASCYCVPEQVAHYTGPQFAAQSFLVGIESETICGLVRHPLISDQM